MEGTPAERPAASETSSGAAESAKGEGTDKSDAQDEVTVTAQAETDEAGETSQEEQTDRQ